jgi:sigma-E factor negative regulatory protein RseC
MQTQESSLTTEEGMIQRVSFNKAFVRIQRSSCCAGCSSRGACQVLSDKEMIVEVQNDLEASVGDTVELSVPTRSLLKLSLLVYFVPIVALLIGAYAGGRWAEALGMQSPLAAILGGALAMAVSFYLLKSLDRAAHAGGKYLPRMTRVLVSADSPPSDGNK